MLKKQVFTITFMSHVSVSGKLWTAPLESGLKVVKKPMKWLELYDIDRDPYEKSDISGEKPEVNICTSLYFVFTLAFAAFEVSYRISVYIWKRNVSVRVSR